jgi:hypothetical protein
VDFVSRRNLWQPPPKYLTDQATFNKEWKRLVTLRDETKKRTDELQTLIGLLESHSSLPGEVTESLNQIKIETINEYTAEVEKLKKILKLKSRGLRNFVMMRLKRCRWGQPLKRLAYENCDNNSVCVFFTLYHEAVQPRTRPRGKVCF